MSRHILAIVGILFCSASALGQEFVAPKNNPVIQSNNSGFQPPSNPTFAPIKQEAEVQKPQIEEVPIIIPTKKENKATIQPAPTIRSVPVNPITEKPETNVPFQEKPDPSSLTPLRPQPPAPEWNPVEQNNFEPKQVTPSTTVIQPAPNQSIELPKPKPEIKTVELKEDTQAYRSSQYNSSGVSDYRLQVAREKARARRMRMEVKKWYGVDTARPVVRPRVDISVYSGYYNGVYSRYGTYANPYHNGSNFYYSFPVGR